MKQLNVALASTLLVGGVISIFNDKLGAIVALATIPVWALACVTFWCVGHIREWLALDRIDWETVAANADASGVRSTPLTARRSYVLELLREAMLFLTLLAGIVMTGFFIRGVMRGVLVPGTTDYFIRALLAINPVLMGGLYCAIRHNKRLSANPSLRRE